MGLSVNKHVDLLTFVCVLATGLINVNSFVLGADDEVQCGVPEIQPVSKRIIGGHEARPGTWPWIVLLAEDGFHICGGSILNEKIILTAAHCFDREISKRPERWLVYAGKYHIKKVDSTQTVHRVGAIISYPGYTNATYKHDIALILLQEPIAYSDYARPICIPPNYRRVVPVNTMCYTAGWGETRGTADPYALNQVGVPLLHDYWCSRPDWYGSKFIPRVTFCAGYSSGGKDACLGDSGGPYICKVNGTWFQQGIVSWGYDCAQPRWPGIYTDVSKYRNWIIETMSNLGYPLKG